MDLPSESSRSSSDSAQCNPSDKCRRSSSDTYNVSSCPFNMCPECRELETVDAQIMDLSKRRHELTRKINLRHDRLTSKLPLELISEIFTFAVVDQAPHYRYAFNDEEKSTLWNPAVRLGAVCKRWREMTFRTPQLWTELIITEKNLKNPFLPQIISQRLDISSSLPLSLEFDIDCDLAAFPVLPYSNIVALLRSQAHRWKDLTVRTEIHGTVLTILLMGLEAAVTLDSLVIENPIYSDEELSKLEIAKRYPFSLKRLNIEYVPLRFMPVRWDVLTHLTANHISVDNLVEVFRRAHNLQSCRLEVVREDDNHYPLPISPVTNTSIIEFVADSSIRVETDNFEGVDVEILGHLILPSLEILDYHMVNSDPFSLREMEVLSNFLDRSQPPLRRFSFSYLDNDSQFRRDWYRALPSITSLEIRIIDDNNGERIRDFLERLGADKDPMALPSVRELKIYAQKWNLYFWNALAAMFPDYESDKGASSVVPRPLKKVSIYLYKPANFKEQTIPEVSYLRLRDIMKSGITLQFFSVQANTWTWTPESPLGTTFS